MDDRAWLLLIGVCLSLPIVLVAWIWAMVVTAA